MGYIFSGILETPILLNPCVGLTAAGAPNRPSHGLTTVLGRTFLGQPNLIMYGIPGPSPSQNALSSQKIVVQLSETWEGGMNPGFAESLRAEIAALEAELEADIRFKRLTELKKILGLYPSIGESGFQKDRTPTGGEPAPQARVGQSRPRMQSPDRQRILKTAGMFIDNRKGPVPTKEILKHLEDQGIRVPGKLPLNNLSAMLSNSEEFKSFGRAGWKRKMNTENGPRQVMLNDMLPYGAENKRETESG